RAAAEPKHSDGRVDVVVALEPLGFPNGAVGVDLDDLLAGHEVDRVEVVDVEVAEDAPGRRDVGLGRGLGIVRGGANDEELPDGSRRNRVARSAKAGVEAALEPDLDERAGPLDVVE